MVGKLFKKLFNIRDTKPQAKFTGTPAAVKRQQHAQATSSIVLTSNETGTSPSVDVDLSALFYGLLFPQQPHGTVAGTNKLEKKVMAEIEQALTAVDVIAESTLKLPSKIVELDRQLADDSIDTDALIALIEQDPLLSVEVLKLCNSPAFRRSDKDITSLQQALVQLGRSQLRRFVSSCLAREMIDIKPIYFRRFGAKVWRHSMQVAFLASELANENTESVFLLGLLHDVGKIAIFKLLIDAFYQAEPGEQPRSLLFSQVMTSKSLTLSALLAKEWQLPPTFSDNLALLANSDNVPQPELALAIWQANIISECSMLKQENKLSDAALVTLTAKVGISIEQFETLHEKLIQFN
ncbi:HDOD domain-containing protein [Shewanella maritima]|uniref:HDOD domain-containing protein n=1 Tax=Shewanella maritima TaxID=2520507 RepID=UPI0037367B5D